MKPFHSGTSKLLCCAALCLKYEHMYVFSVFAAASSAIQIKLGSDDEASDSESVCCSLITLCAPVY